MTIYFTIHYILQLLLYEKHVVDSDETTTVGSYGLDFISFYPRH